MNVVWRGLALTSLARSGTQMLSLRHPVRRHRAAALPTDHTVILLLVRGGRRARLRHSSLLRHCLSPTVHLHLLLLLATAVALTGNLGCLTARSHRVAMLLLLLISCVILATVLRVVHLLLVALRVRDSPRLNMRLLRQVGL